MLVPATLEQLCVKYRELTGSTDVIVISSDEEDTEAATKRYSKKTKTNNGHQGTSTKSRIRGEGLNGWHANGAQK